MSDYRLRLRFNDGSVRDFDCKPLIEEYPIFSPLKDENIFREITLDGWTVTWDNGTLDIAPEHLFERGTHVPVSYGFDDDTPLPVAAEE